MNAFIINLKDPGRGFSPSLSAARNFVGFAPCVPRAPCHFLPGPFLNRKEVYSCEDNNNP